MSRSELIAKASLLALSLTAGNFLFQGLREAPDLSQAMERSFFQVIAVAVCCLFLREPPQ